MKLYNTIINPLIFGTWILRITNDINIDKGLNYIQIQEEPIIKLKTLKQDKLVGQKKSRTAYINDINYLGNDSYSFRLLFSKKNIYSYSFLGIQIPEIKSNSLSYVKEQNYTMNFYDKTLIITDNDNYLYYIFDLCIGNLKYPNTETNINTFIFTQIFSILLSIIITKAL
jgi:hypothetical protein